MRIVEMYSHLDGKEFLIVHQKPILDEIVRVIKSINANKFKTKRSKEKTITGIELYSPIEINEDFKKKFGTYLAEVKI